MKTPLTLLCLGVAASTAFGALVAMDNAGNSAYGDGWQTGDNGGSGFNAWTLSGGPDAGFFIGNSANNAGGSGNINSSGNRAWGLFANSGAVASAIRPFGGGALSAGQQFILRMDNGFVQNGGTVGFGLQNGLGQNRFEFFFVGGETSYKYNVGGVSTSTGIAFTGNGITLAFKLGAANAFLIEVTPVGGMTSQFAGTLAASDISQLRLFNANAGHGGNNDLFFNNLQIIPEPTHVALGLFGAALLASGCWRKVRQWRALRA